MTKQTAFHWLWQENKPHAQKATPIFRTVTSHLRIFIHTDTLYRLSKSTYYLYDKQTEAEDAPSLSRDYDWKPWVNTQPHKHTLSHTYTHTQTDWEGTERAGVPFGTTPAGNPKWCKARGYHSNRLVGHWFWSQCNSDAGSMSVWSLQCKRKWRLWRGWS